MPRLLTAWIPLGLLVLTCGCAMCAHPYDECGPTFGSLCGDNCQPGTRAGSILAGQHGAAYPGPMMEPGMEGEFLEDELTPTPALPQPEPQTAPPAPAGPRVPSPSPSNEVTKSFPGIPRESIISVTDRKVEDGSSKPHVEAESQAETEPQVQSEEPPARVAARSASSSGWNARKVNLRRPR